MRSACQLTSGGYQFKVLAKFFYSMGLNLDAFHLSQARGGSCHWAKYFSGKRLSAASLEKLYTCVAAKNPIIAVLTQSLNKSSGTFSTQSGFLDQTNARARMLLRDIIGGGKRGNNSSAIKYKNVMLSLTLPMRLLLDHDTTNCFNAGTNKQQQ